MQYHRYVQCLVIVLCTGNLFSGSWDLNPFSKKAFGFKLSRKNPDYGFWPVLQLFAPLWPKIQQTALFLSLTLHKKSPWFQKVLHHKTWYILIFFLAVWNCFFSAQIGVYFFRMFWMFGEKNLVLLTYLSFEMSSFY